MNPPKDQPPRQPPRRPPPIELQPLDQPAGPADAAPASDPAADRAPFELIPLADDALPASAKHPPPGGQSAGEDPSPVPDRPLHLCPSCDYNLTGLTSRRCPECGEPFNLTDARIHGLDRTVLKSGSTLMRLRLLMATELSDRVRLIAGVALAIGAFLAANYAGLVGRPGRSLVSFRGGLMVILAFPTVAMGIYLQVTLGWKPSMTAMFIGMLMAVLAVVLCVL